MGLSILPDKSVHDFQDEGAELQVFHKPAASDSEHSFERFNRAPNTHDFDAVVVVEP